MARREAETSIPRINFRDPSFRVVKSAMADSSSTARRLAILALAVLALSCRSSKAPKIDAHCHLAAEAVPRAIELMDRNGIAAAVNLSGGVPGRGLEEQLKAAARYPGRILVFANLDWYEPSRGRGYGERMAASVARAPWAPSDWRFPGGWGLDFATSRAS